MMEKLFLILLGLTIALCISYFLLIANYCYGWLITKTHKSKNDDSIFVSIIIAVRNEEKNIFKCLNAIVEQTYSSNQFEIIVVDDASTDETNKIVQNFSEKYTNIKLITLLSDGENTGKKAAIKKGIENAKGELIVTTDGDCWMEKNWLTTIASFYEKTNAKMIIAPVCFQNEKNSFEKMQSLEFMALIACGGASLYYNMAIMCNGANLAYPKRVFEELNGFEGVNEKASGDDVLLMYKIKKKYSKGLKFLKSQDAIVFTEAKPDLKSFIHQRKRWASKGFKVLNMETKAVALLIYCFSFLLITLPISGSICLRNTPFYPAFIEICLILLLIKCFIDFLLLFLAATFFKKKKLLIYFLPEQLIYMLYVVLIGFIGTIGKYEWKGRQIN